MLIGVVCRGENVCHDTPLQKEVLKWPGRDKDVTQIKIYETGVGLVARSNVGKWGKFCRKE